jgi:N6-L-threonylcarbamoyladenine synthase
VLVKKTERAVAEYKVKQLVVAGGVAANKGLRTALENTFRNHPKVELVIPPLALCTDNAAMIAAAGSVMFEKGIRAGMNLNANPGLEIELYNE